MKDATTRSDDSMQGLRDDIEAIRKDIGSLIKKGLKGHDGLRKSIGDAGHRLSDLADEARDRAEHVHRRVTDTASERPLTTIAIAVAAGLIGGKLIAWMTSDKR